MIDDKKIKEYVRKMIDEDKMHNDEGIKKYTNKIVDELGNDEDVIISYIDSLNDEDLYDICVVFFDLSKKLNSKTLYEKMRKIEENHPNVHIHYEVEETYIS